MSALQEDAINTLGRAHSDEVDKFENLNYTLVGSAILINDASVNMVVEVIDVLHLPGIEENNLVYGLVKSYSKSDAPMLTAR